MWDYWKEDLLTMFSYCAPVIRHSVQTMCTMFSRKDFFRLFGGLLRISTRKTNAEARYLSSLDGYDGAICAATLTKAKVWVSYGKLWPIHGPYMGKIWDG